MSIILTGGAGFIGSCVLKALNEKGFNDVIIVDDILTSEKWKNINGKSFLTYINKNCYLKMLRI
jgi:ADP-L-glycero-D-manno-heptose 6-epimerase